MEAIHHMYTANRLDSISRYTYYESDTASPLIASLERAENGEGISLSPVVPLSREDVDTLRECLHLCVHFSDPSTCTIALSAPFAIATRVCHVAGAQRRACPREKKGGKKYNAK